ncbi:hypothetical protein K2F45_11345 [Sphingobacterium siyangense]|uniref:hypothetical protein n=1 Tax=Sphingobacterium TaxID=28453 RepID=UPI000957EE19|nr:MULTISPECIES: hypothetical protein [Sphingobacterium]APU97118.1 hypothetical protein BV902_12800 [Sphingobacterium sp. B29]UQA77531.1 hypothetical protein K2F45_11345 [Sphingobacterium siyangense]
MKVLKFVLLISLLSIFLRCSKSSDFEKGQNFPKDLTFKPLLSSTLKKLPLKIQTKMNYALSHNTVYLNWGDNQQAMVTTSDNASLEIRKITGACFLMRFDNDKKEFEYQDEFGEKRNFYFKSGAFYNKEDDQPFNKEWYKDLKIDQQDLFTIPEVYAVLDKGNLIPQSPRKIHLQNADKLIKAKSLALNNKLRQSKSTLMAVDAPPCNNYCRSGQSFHLSQIMACENATVEVNSGCCSNAYCIGCCSIIGCDCATVIGSYLAVCTAVAKSCSGYGSPIATSPVWGQCGGNTWTGPTACTPGNKCVFINSNYSQCQPL